MEMKKERNDINTTIKRSVYWRVIDEIVNGIRTRQYRPGSQLPTEIEFMEKLKLSRSSVREAIKVLSAIGIVVIRRGEGTFIADADDMIMVDSIAYTLLMENTPPEEALEFRFYIDDMVLRIAVEKITDENILELEEIIALMQQAYEEKDLDYVRELDVQFHLRIVDFTQNRYIKKMVSGVYEFIAPEIIMKNPNSQEFFEVAENSHVDVISFLKTKDFSILDKNTHFQRSRIWYRYYDAENSI